MMRVYDHWVDNTSHAGLRRSRPDWRLATVGREYAAASVPWVQIYIMENFGRNSAYSYVMEWPPPPTVEDMGSIIADRYISKLIFLMSGGFDD